MVCDEAVGFGKNVCTVGKREMPEIIRGRDPGQRVRYALTFGAAIAVSEAFAQYAIRSGVALNSIAFVIPAAFFYMAVCMMLYASFFYENVGHMNLIWSCMSIIIAFAVGWYRFDEPFNRFTVLAIALAISAVYSSYLADKYA